MITYYDGLWGLGKTYDINLPHENPDSILIKFSEKSYSKLLEPIAALNNDLIHQCEVRVDRSPLHLKILSDLDVIELMDTAIPWTSKRLINEVYKAWVETLCKLDKDVKCTIQVYIPDSMDKYVEFLTKNLDNPQWVKSKSVNPDRIIKEIGISDFIGAYIYKMDSYCYEIYDKTENKITSSNIVSKVI